MQSHTVPVASLAETVRRAWVPLALLGDQGGVSLITGAIVPSGVVRGTVSVETEHGTVYLDEEGEVEVVPAGS